MSVKTAGMKTGYYRSHIYLNNNKYTEPRDI